MKKSLPFTFYLLYYAAASFTLPFIILYLQGLRFSGAQIGLLMGLIPLVTMMGAPFWTRLADAKFRHNFFMSVTILGTVLFVSIFPLLSAYAVVLAVSILYAFFSSPIISFADSATMAMLANEKVMYGRVRVGGTIGWGIMAPIAGLIIQNYGIKWAFWGYAAIMLIAFIVSQRFSFGTSAEESPNPGGIRQILANRRWIYFLILAFIAGAGLTSINSYLFPYMEELGISRATMGIALTISTIGELPVLFFANRLLKRFGAYGLLVLGMIVTGVRLILYAWLNFTTGILVFQLINGMTFPIIWVAGVSYANENAPQGMKATAQGLFGAMSFGIGAATGGFVGGLLLGSMGGRGMYFIFGVTVLLGTAIISMLDRARRTLQVEVDG